MCFSDAGGRTEARSAGSRGRLGALSESSGAFRGPEAGSSVPSGLQDEHRSRGAASVPSFMLQGESIDSATNATLLFMILL